MNHVDPTIPGLNHIGLCVADLEKSRDFFDAIMPLMDWRVVDDEGEATYICGNLQIYLQSSREPSATFRRYGIGLQHLAFNAPSRERVDALYQALMKMGANVTEAPAEYPRYSPLYYAVFFTCPSGIALEYCHTPDLAL